MLKYSHKQDKNMSKIETPPKQPEKKSSKAPLIIAIIICALIVQPLIGLFVLVLVFDPYMLQKPYSLEKDEQNVAQVVKKEYPSYEVKSVRLTYTDFFSTVVEADKDHVATSATATAENDTERITIHLMKDSFILFSVWRIESANPDSGPNIPDDVYFIEMNYRSIGKAVNIDEHIKGLWIIPYEDGSLYKKAGVSDWYYSIKVCDNIYKTSGGKIYVFNKQTSDWEESNETYSRLNYYGNYQKISKEEALDIIEKYSDYRE